jgi:hypothetical protein
MPLARHLLLVGLFAPSAALAAEEEAARYAHVKVAIAEIDAHAAELDARIARRIQRKRGPSLSCLQGHRAAVGARAELAQRERSALIEALADGELERVDRHHRAIAIVQVQVRAQLEEANTCPLEREQKPGRSALAAR